LNSVKVKSAPSAIGKGPYIMDAVASWIDKGYVVGTFKKPPFEHYRVNPLMAATQKTEVRLILNVSSPKGNSINEAKDELSIQKIKMSSPRIFAEELLKAGKGAFFQKSNIVDA
jgi:hypothetical protein